MQQSMKISSPLDIIIHIHQVSDGFHIIRDVRISPNRMFYGAAGHCKMEQLHWLIVIHDCIDQTGRKGISTAYPVQYMIGTTVKNVESTPRLASARAIFASAPP